jgi:hypothetical protein
MATSCGKQAFYFEKNVELWLENVGIQHDNSTFVVYSKNYKRMARNFCIFLRHIAP